MVGLKMREGLKKEANEEEMRESGGPQHSHFESSATMGDEQFRVSGGPTAHYALPVKYKLVIVTLLALCGILILITIIQGMRLFKIR